MIITRYGHTTKILKQCEFYVNLLRARKCRCINNLDLEWITLFLKTLYETNFYWKVFYLENTPLNSCSIISKIEIFLDNFAKNSNFIEIFSSCYILINQKKLLDHKEQTLRYAQ